MSSPRSSASRRACAPGRRCSRRGAPPVRSTRWQGTTIGIGLAPSALPAARAPRGLPARRRPRRRSRPRRTGSRAVACSTRRPNGRARAPSRAARSKRVAPAGEVLVELAADVVQARRGASRIRGRERAGEVVERRVDAAVAVLVGEAREAARRCRRRRACRPGVSSVGVARRRPARRGGEARGGRGGGRGVDAGRCGGGGHAVVRSSSVRSRLRPSCAALARGLLACSPAPRRPRVGEVAGEAQQSARRAARAAARGRASQASPSSRVGGRRAPARPGTSPTGTGRARARAVVVDRLAVGDRQHPGAQVVAVAQPRVGPQRRQERLLEAVVGRRRGRRRRRGSARRRRAARRGSAGRAGRASRAATRAARPEREVSGVVVRRGSRAPVRDAEPALGDEPAQQRRGAVALARRARRAAPSRTTSTWSRPIRSPQASGPRGWLRPSTMPASTSAGAADALADGERRLVDELADDPAEHEARARRRPTRVRRPERAEERLGALGGGAASSPAPRVSSTRPPARAAAARGSRPRRRRRRARRASPRRTSTARGPPCSGGSSAVAPPQSTIRNGHLAVGVARRRATSQPAAVASARSSSAIASVAGDHDEPAVAGAAAPGAGGSSRPVRRAVVVGVPAAAGLAAEPPGGDHPRAQRRRAPARLAEAQLVERLRRPRSRRRCRRGPAARTGPCESRRRGARCGRSSRRRRCRSCTSAQRLEAERPAAAVDEEARAVGGVDDALAHRLAGRARDAPARARRTARRRSTSTQLHHRRRVEEVHADDALGPRRRARRSR